MHCKEIGTRYHFFAIYFNVDVGTQLTLQCQTKSHIDVSIVRTYKDIIKLLIKANQFT